MRNAFVGGVQAKSTHFFIDRDPRERREDERRLALWARKSPAQKADLIAVIANAEAAKTPADPFTYARVAAALLNNAACPEDYGWEFGDLVKAAHKARNAARRH